MPQRFATAQPFVSAFARTSAMLGLLALTTSAPARAQQPAPIAYDRCSSMWDYFMMFECSIAIATPATGAAPLWLTQFVAPLWLPSGAAMPVRSPDGSMLAYQMFDLTGVWLGTFAIDFGTWNVTTFPVTGTPTWSPDGRRIAILGYAGLFVMNANGSGMQQVSSNATGDAIWSPDGARLVFPCQIDTGNPDICAVNTDGTGFARLTNDVASDSSPAYAPDGSTIAFVTTRFGPGTEIALMNPNGSGVRRVGSGVVGSAPAWSPDGRRIAYVSGSSVLAMNADGSDTRYLGPYAPRVVWSPDGAFVASSDTCGLGCGDAWVTVMRADGSGIVWTGYGADVDWTRTVRPVAMVGDIYCSYTVCSFDGSRSWGTGTIVGYQWAFGDGTSGSGAMISHTFPVTGGTYQVTLTVTDSAGAQGSRTKSVTTNAPTWTPTVWFNSPAAGAAYAAPATILLSVGISDNASPTKVEFYDGASLIGTVTAPPWEKTWSNVPVGSHTVIARYTDSVGLTATATISVIVSDVPLAASFTYTCAGATCTFDASRSQGPVAKYTWNFGDRLTATGQTVTHTYGGTGGYVVTLTVADSGTASATTKQTVVVKGKSKQ